MKWGTDLGRRPIPYFCMRAPKDGGFGSTHQSTRGIDWSIPLCAGGEAPVRSFMIRGDGQMRCGFERKGRPGLGGNHIDQFCEYMVVSPLRTPEITGCTLDMSGGLESCCFVGGIINFIQGRSWLFKFIGHVLKWQRKEKKNTTAMRSRPLVKSVGPLLMRHLLAGLPQTLPLSAPPEDKLPTHYISALPLDKEPSS